MDTQKSTCDGENRSLYPDMWSKGPFYSGKKATGSLLQLLRCEFDAIVAGVATAIFQAEVLTCDQAQFLPVRYFLISIIVAPRIHADLR